MSQLIIFNELKAQLTAIAGIKHVALWNNQLEHENEENPFLYPCLFIEFTNENFVDLASGVQQFDSLITLHLGFESYKDEDTSILTLKDLVYSTVHTTQNNTESSKLLRVGEVQNFDHPNVQLYEIQFKTTIKDFGADERATNAQTVTTLTTPIIVT